MAVVFVDSIGGRNLVIGGTTTLWAVDPEWWYGLNQGGGLPMARATSTSAAAPSYATGNDFGFPAWSSGPAIERSFEIVAVVDSATSAIQNLLTCAAGSSEAGDNVHWVARVTSSSFQFVWRTTSGTDFMTATGTTTAGELRHLVATISYTSTFLLEVWIDGVKKASVTTTSGTPTRPENKVGGYALRMGGTGLSSPNQRLMQNGAADIAWFQRKLTDSEIEVRNRIVHGVLG